ncbi:MAG: hypothetical protein JO022_21925 [Acidobacteriaceae bacterium]|nr:hypothetical protein [Acidobacteriaceae bacterium]
MRPIGLPLLGLVLAISGYAQPGRPYGGIGGFGNVLYPGTGHAPNAPSSVIILPRLNSTTTTTSSYSGRPGYPGATRVNHGYHNRNTIVTYPVVVGGYYPYGYGYDQGAAPPPQGGDQTTVMGGNGVPSVVVNQTFIPDRATPVVREYGPAPEGAAPPEQSGMRTYEGLRTQPQPDPRDTKASDEPTLYLIAFKDHHIVPALGYWVEGTNLHYVSAEHSLNQASLDLIDRQMSQQLNDERHVEFRLSKAQ